MVRSYYYIHDVTIPSEPQCRTEIIRAVPDVDDAVIVHTVAFKERVELATCVDARA
jgi:hypothetical protein